MSARRGEPAQHVRVAIIGAGFGGLGTAIRLKQTGVDDFVVFDKAPEVGGTWQINTYPGAQCDIPSIIYSFSFAPNPEWSRLYPLQEELLGYLKKCVSDFGIEAHLRLATEVTDASWDDPAHLWRIATTSGSYTADVVVGAIGPFSSPSIPDLPGLADFEGTLFHSQGWDHDHDLTGERVGVVGTGASAVQFIPRIQPDVDTLTVFQRTPTWILPHPDRPVAAPVRAALKRVPGAHTALRRSLEAFQETLVPGFVFDPRLQKPLELLGRRHLRKQVTDPALRAALTPSYGLGCKRPTFSNAYYPALAAENVDVVTAGIERVTSRGVLTSDGVEHELDTLILATGFRMTDHPGFHVLRGRGGRTLGEVWEGGEMEAYLGTVVHGFPNLFLILGPNAGVYTSAVITIEAQVNYIVDALQEMERADLAVLEVRPEVQDEFNAWVEHGLRRSVWLTGGCSSYYLSPSGRNFTHYPGFSAGFHARTRSVALADFDTRAASPDPILQEAVR